MSERIFADYNATTPATSAHYKAVFETLRKVDGNPSSIHHFGREAKVATENFRSDLAYLLGADSQEIVFTSGATEANNMVVQGIVTREYDRTNDKLPHIIITAAEHSSVLAPAQLMAERGVCRLTVVPVTKVGIVDKEALYEALCEETCLVAMIFANNEVGSINPVRELSSAIKGKFPNIHVHVDAVQALGKLDLRWVGGSDGSYVDSLSVSGHKIGGLKGIGALFLRRGTQFPVLIAGGGQERSRRGGTENIPGIVSFGLRARELKANPGWLDHVKELTSRFRSDAAEIPGLHLHGVEQSSQIESEAFTLETTVNFHIDGLPGEDLLLNFDLAGIAVSTGSACSSGSSRPSHVLKAMGYTDWEALNSIRLSFGYDSKKSDVTSILKILKQVAKRNRS